MQPTFLDTVTLLSTEIDAFKNETVTDQADVAAVFDQSTGWRNANGQAAITSDAVALLDPDDPFIIAANYRLEAMLLIANPLGGDYPSAWYRITECSVARYGQLDNGIDHVEVRLKKTAGIQGVS